jgi:GNAT superfamily N-acetyltransferase
MSIYYQGYKLPSFARAKYIKAMKEKGYLHYIYRDDKEIGFYIQEGEKLKYLFIIPPYRGYGIAQAAIEEAVKANENITIAITKRNCPIKHIVQELGFTNTHVSVKGKEIWASNDYGKSVRDYKNSKIYLRNIL